MRKTAQVHASLFLSHHVDEMMSPLCSYNTKYHWKCSVQSVLVNTLSLISLRI